MANERETRRQFLAAVAGVSALGLSGCSSDESPTPTTGDAIVTGTSTTTETPTAESESQETSAPGSTPTADSTDEETDTPEPTATATPDPKSLAEWPTFMRNDQNWGHHSDATGPHDEVSVVWERDLDANQVNATPSLANGTLYVGDGRANGDNGTFYALNPLTGETKWSESFDGPVRGGATIADGIVYIGAGGSMVAFRENGNEVWRHDSRSDETFTAPTMGEGNIYFGADSGRLYKFDALSKTKKWDPKLYGAITTAPIFDDGSVYVSAQDGSVQSRSSGTSTDWEKDFGDSVNGLSMRDGRLYAASESGRLIQLNARGTEVWSAPTPGPAAATPAVTGDLVYVGTRHDTFVALNVSDGFEEWRFTDASNGFTAPPVVADGTVYVGCRDNNVYALDAETGELEWSFETGNNIVEAAPIVAGGTVFVGSQDGKIYALSD